MFRLVLFLVRGEYGLKQLDYDRTNYCDWCSRYRNHQRVAPFMKAAFALTLAVIAIALTMGCGQKVTVVEHQYRKIVSSFYNEALIRHKPVIQRWVDFSEDYLPVTTLAVCKYNNTKSSIVINTYSWSSLSEVEKEIVIYHELGHCVLGLKHDNTKVDHDWVLSSPLSIMYPYVLEQDWYLKNKKEYLDELFSRNRYEIFEEAQ